MKNWRFLTVVLEKILESPLDSKIKPVNATGNQPWIFIGKTDAEAEASILWPTNVKSWLIGKDPDAGKDWKEEKGTTEGEMVGWHHWLNGHEFEQTLGDSGGQGSLACCSPWGHKESDTIQWLNNTVRSVPSFPILQEWMECCVVVIDQEPAWMHWSKFIFFFLKCIYLTVLGLSCSTWNFWSFQHTGSLVEACGI